MSPGKARLWTGISCVGTMVTIAVAMLISDFPHRLFAETLSGGTADFTSFLMFFASAALLLLPFDLIGGIWIPVSLESQTLKASVWLRRWARSVGIQIIFYSVTFFVYLQVGQGIGTPWLIVIFAMIQIALLAGQELIWRIMAAQNAGVAGRGAIQFVPHFDPRFAGGITGMPGFESIVIPADWQTRLAPSNLEMLIARRIAARNSGGRVRGVLWAMLWNIISLTVAILLTGGAIVSVADLVTTFLWFLLLSFVGLLLLPAINRKSVFALDHQVASHVNKMELQEAIGEIDKLTEQDPTRSASAESIFQPIPCPERRLLSLEKEGPQRVLAWNVARTTLYLSWAFGGPLARAVHCNVGRPELWAMLPSD
jgi:hypothetical protein